MKDLKVWLKFIGIFSLFPISFYLIEYTDYSFIGVIIMTLIFIILISRGGRGDDG
jgi:hypothetical protein